MIKSNLMDVAFLDSWRAKLQSTEDVAETMMGLVSELQQVRNALSTEDWKQIATSAYRQHPIMALLHQDPFTLRAFAKPRGYAGDAEMLDFIYAEQDGFTLPALVESTELGRRICNYTSNGEAPRAVRVRRRIIVERLNDLVTRKPQPHILSMACGYLREAKGCSAFLEGRIGRYVAVDHDRESLVVVERALGSFGVEAVHASVRDVLLGKLTFAGFDLIYAAGLYDYLTLPLAQGLSKRLFSMLNPGGQLLLANFTPHLINAGYMEAYMDWWLIYRTEAELLQCAAPLPVEQIETIATFVDKEENMAFLEIERKG